MKQIGRYRLDRVLGSGAFATVWKGYDPELDVPVAVKVLADNWAANADVRERFLTEARLLRRIQSPRVVRVYDVGLAPPAADQPGQPYFVMDYVEGGPLTELVGRLPAEEAIRLAREAAEAAQVLHDNGIIHRDLKPGNFLTDTRYAPLRVLVADLGSAKKLADATGYTVTTGSPAYMAPEQADQLGGFDSRADVYALGVVSYELLSGHRPFAGLNAGELMLRTSDVRPEPIAAGLGLPAEVDAVLARAVDPDPDGRPPDAQSFGAALSTAADAATGSQAEAEFPTTTFRRPTPTAGEDRDDNTVVFVAPRTHGDPNDQGPSTGTGTDAARPTASTPVTPAAEQHRQQDWLRVEDATLPVDESSAVSPAPTAYDQRQDPAQSHQQPSTQQPSTQQPSTRQPSTQQPSAVAQPVRPEPASTPPNVRRSTSRPSGWSASMVIIVAAVLFIVATAVSWVFR